MTDDWKNAGAEVRARRKFLGLRQGDLAKLGGPSEALVRELESGRYSADMQDAMRGGLERSLKWAPGSLGDLLAGGHASVLPEYEAIQRPEGDVGLRLEEALEQFHAAAAQLVHAEAAVDRAMKQWSIRELLRQRLVSAIEEIEKELGRPLTDVERITKVQSLSRPTPIEIAEMVGWAARYDDREWTRYEMAIIEAIETDYPQDVRVGSAYADLEPFRERVRRLGPIPTLELAQPGPWPPVSEVDDTLPAAAEEGDIEDSGENSI